MAFTVAFHHIADALMRYWDITSAAGPETRRRRPPSPGYWCENEEYDDFYSCSMEGSKSK